MTRLMTKDEGKRLIAEIEELSRFYELHRPHDFDKAAGEGLDKKFPVTKSLIKGLVELIGVEEVSLLNPDDEAVEDFAHRMMNRLAEKREEGFSGWNITGDVIADEMMDETIIRRFVENVRNPDYKTYLDLANLVMMLDWRGCAPGRLSAAVGEDVMRVLGSGDEEPKGINQLIGILKDQTGTQLQIESPPHFYAEAALELIRKAKVTSCPGTAITLVDDASGYIKWLGDEYRKDGNPYIGELYSILKEDAEDQLEKARKKYEGVADSIVESM